MCYCQNGQKHAFYPFQAPPHLLSCSQQAAAQKLTTTDSRIGRDKKIPAGKCLEKIYFEDLIKETGKKKKENKKATHKKKNPNPLMIKKRAPTFLGHQAQFHCRKETAHTWPSFRRADVQQQRFSNRRIDLHAVPRCCWPHGRSLPGVGSRKPHSKRERLVTPRPPGGAPSRPAWPPPGQAPAASWRTASPPRVSVPGWCPRRAPGARCPGSCPPCRSARRPPSPPGGTRSRWRRARRWKACGTAGAASCPSSASRPPGAAAAPGGCPAPPRSPRR